MKRIKFLYKAALLIICIFSSHTSFSQDTGSFNAPLYFNGDPSWQLSCYVPPSYNAANKYKLIICIHGVSTEPGASEQLRDLFVSSNLLFNWDTLGLVTNPRSPVYNAIVICPYLYGSNTDLWQPIGDTALITKIIEYASYTYNIDPHYIYLSGYSLGGRGALRYGLINYWRFRGLILFTPAFQSMPEVDDSTPFYFPYKNGRYIPTYISVGSSDASYSPIVPVGYQNLSDSGAIATMQVIYGLGHDPGPNDNTFFAFNYVDSHATSYAMNDAGISEISSPYEEICSASFTPVVTIQNKGRNRLTAATINYQIDNGTVNTYNWSGNLIQLGVDKVSLPLQTVSVGTHTFKAYTSMPNGVADTVPSNDTMTESFTSISSGAALLYETFEEGTFPPVGWRQSGTDSAYNWIRGSSNNNEFSLYGPFEAGAYKQSLSCIYFDNAVPNNYGKRYSIITPACDLTGTSNPILQYDYAYAPWNQYASDTLAVYYSIDCGNTWHTLLVKGGTALSTLPGSGYDNSNIFVPTSSEWKHQSINLTTAGLGGKNEVMFSFENRSGYGNLMYLDNIAVNTGTGVANETPVENSLNVYPNPSNGRFTIEMKEADKRMKTIEVYNVLGKEVYSTLSNINSPLQIDLSNEATGIYLYRVLSENGQLIGEGKLIIR